MNPFSSIEGWLELGNITEAAAGFNRLPPELSSTVEYCRLGIVIYSHEKAWSKVEIMCKTVIEHAPGDPVAIMARAEAFHQQGRSREAFASLQYGPVELQRGGAYFYALARYLCAMGQNRFALTCLDRAFDFEPALRPKALGDPDLKEVWPDLEKS